MDTLIIRQERPSEFQTIYDLVKTAFKTAKVSNGDEQDFVDKLRAGANYIPELALVAEESGNIIGHIMLTKTYITTGDSRLEALLLAPLCVALEYREKGVGSKLVARSFQLAKNRGFQSVFVVGNPDYYSRFGFKSSVLFGIRHVPPIPDQFVMVYELRNGALLGVNGTVSFS